MPNEVNLNNYDVYVEVELKRTTCYNVTWLLDILASGLPWLPIQNNEWKLWFKTSNQRLKKRLEDFIQDFNLSLLSM
jgi:hypothetical protein